MKIQIRRFLRRWSWWFFEKQIRVVWVSRTLSGHDVAMMKAAEIARITEYIKRDLIRSIAERLAEEGLIEFTEHDDQYSLGREIRAKLRVI